MITGLSYGGTTMLSSPQRPDKVLVGTIHGLFLLQRGQDGQEWAIARRGLDDFHIGQILVDQESGQIFVGTFADGIYCSEDDGRTWERRGAGLSGQLFSMAASRHDGSLRLYAGTEPPHLYFSDDRALTWADVPAFQSVPNMDAWTFPADPHIAHLKHINFAPDDQATIYASVEMGGLYKSSDSGDTWTEIPGMNYDVHRTVIDPSDPNRIFTTGGDGIYATTDGGLRWEQRTTAEDNTVGGYPDFMVLDPQNPQTMFVAGALRGPATWPSSGLADARICRSDDGGRTWARVRGGLPDPMQPAIESMCLIHWGESFSLFMGTTAGEVYCSDDGGLEWSRIAGGMPTIAKGGSGYGTRAALASNGAR
jgi:photosystem II stability/assembly factor-like uncharacterized protein